jgi:hypothetical protein
MVRWFRVPDTAIDHHQGGYLLHLGGGVKLVLWGMPKPEGWQPEQESSP